MLIYSICFAKIECLFWYSSFRVSMFLWSLWFLAHSAFLFHFQILGYLLRLFTLNPHRHFRFLVWTSYAWLSPFARGLSFALLWRPKVCEYICLWSPFLPFRVICRERHPALWFIVHRMILIVWLHSDESEDTLCFLQGTIPSKTYALLLVREVQPICHILSWAVQTNRTKRGFRWGDDTVRWIFK